MEKGRKKGFHPFQEFSDLPLLLEASQAAKIGGWRFLPERETICFTGEIYRILNLHSVRKLHFKEFLKLFAAKQRKELEQFFYSDGGIGESFSLDLPLKNKNQWVRITGRVRANRRGQVQMVGTLQEISDLKLKEAQLDGYKDRIQKMKQGISCAELRVCLDPELQLKVELLESDAFAFFNYDDRVDGAFERFFFTQFSNRQRKEFQARFLRNLQKKRFEIEFFYGRGDLPRFMEIHCEKIESDSEDDHMKKWSCFCYDMTERKFEQHDRGHLDEKARQESKLSNIGLLASNLSHEIKNPLTVIHSYAELIGLNLEKGPLTPEFLKNSLDEIFVAIDRIQVITNSITNAVRNDRKSLVFSISDVIEDVIEMSSMRVRKEHMRLRYCRSNEEIPVFGRQSEISQVLTNLINNAVDANRQSSKTEPEDGEADQPMPNEKWVRLSVERPDDKTVWIVVTDSGEGIPEDIAKHIFEKFYTTKERGEGTGLGLSICAQIMQSHGGSLFYKEDAENTTFVCCLPLYDKERSEFFKLAP